MRLIPLVILVLGCHKELPPDLRDKDTGDIDTYTGPPIPEIEVVPLAISFGEVGKDCLGTGRVTISNVGTYPLDVDVIEILDDDSGVFSIVSGEIAFIAPDDTIQVDVGFTPDDYTGFFGQLRIHSDDKDEWEFLIPLDGAVSADPVKTEDFIQVDVPPLDVLLVLDRDATDWIGSFTNEIGTLAGAFSGLGFDFQLAVVNMDRVTAPGVFLGPVPIITGETPNPGQQLTDNINASDYPSDQKSFDSVFEALSVVNPSFVRADATLSVVAYSDDDDFSLLSSSDFATWLEALKADPNDVAYHAIVGAEVLPCFAIPKVADPAPSHIAAVTQTGGEHLKICDYSAVEVVNQLATLISGITASFPLQDPATDTALIVVEVNGVEVDEEGLTGWTYDSDTESIVFHGPGIPPAGAEISVTYPFPTPC